MSSVSSLDGVLRDLGIDDAEIARRMHFLGFSEQDVKRLVEFHRRIEETGECAFFVEVFYRHLLAFPETARFIEDPVVLARLKKTQGEYFHSLTSGHYGSAYVRNRLRVGVAHERVGLAPKWYLGAYNMYLTQLVSKLQEYFSNDATAFAETLRALVKIIFFDMGLAIDTYIHARERAIRAKAAQLEGLSNIAAMLTSSLDLREVLDQIMRRGAELTGSKAACVAFYDSKTQRFTEWAMHGLTEHFVKHMSFRPGGLADEAFTTTTTTTTTVGAYVLSNDRPETKHKLSKLAHEEGITCFICLPLTSHAHRLGVIYFYRSDRDTFDAEEISLLTTFARLAAEAIENARLYEQTREQAMTDSLTGLSNRRELSRRLPRELARVRRSGKTISAVMIDIDHFKRVNDTYGHPAGDAVLQQIAKLLLAHVRDIDTAARYGGEEFLLLLPETDHIGAKLVAERVRRTVEQAVLELPDGRTIGVTISCGIACYPECAEGAEEMISKADQALYTAKLDGRNRVTLYREILKAELERNPSRIAELLNQSIENIEAIVTAVDVKAGVLRQHSHCVRDQALRLGRVLGFGKDELRRLELAAQLHDIGIIAVPDRVLAKSKSFSPQEWEVLRQHPQAAADLLAQVPALHDLVPVIRHHHERFDGGGYPDGLRGEAIPKHARVLSVVDAYCAMVNSCPYREALSPGQARSAIENESGRQFDPGIVRAFLGMLNKDT